MTEQNKELQLLGKFPWKVLPIFAEQTRRALLPLSAEPPLPENRTKSDPPPHKLPSIWHFPLQKGRKGAYVTAPRGLVLRLPLHMRAHHGPQ